MRWYLLPKYFVLYKTRMQKIWLTIFFGYEKFRPEFFGRKDFMSSVLSQALRYSMNHHKAFS